MNNIEERLKAVKEYVDSCTGTLEEAITFLGSFKSLHKEVLLKYAPGDTIYHEAQALLHRVLCWITTEYGLQAESELFFGNTRCHTLKVGDIE